MKMRSFILPLSLAVIIMASCNQGNRTVDPAKVGLSGDTLKAATQKMQEYIENGKLAGISVMVIKEGSVVQRENFGFADIENSLPIKDNTIFRIFSMTKPVTAVALMTLYDEGKFDLDDRVSEYIPEFENVMVYSPGEASHYLAFQDNEMTIRNLLTHTSGIPYGWDPNAFVDSLYRVNGVSSWDGILDEKIKLLAEMPLKSQPGTKWEYGLSIDVAGYLVEAISGQPLDVFMKTRIFDPLKMDDTGFSVPEEKYERLSEVYRLNREASLEKIVNPNGDNFKKPATLFSGGGGLVSTMDDYSRFCLMLLNGGELDGVRILQESTAGMIMSDQLPEGVSYVNGFGYGLAGAVNLKTGEYGWGGAASTNFWIDPANKMIILAFTQFMPSDHTYAEEYKEFVARSIMGKGVE